jgi:MSHA pilin protein MshD
MSLIKQQSGFTLIEIIMTILLPSFSAMIIIPIVQAMLTVTTPVQRQQAVSLGQGLMDEILSKRWDENTPLGGAPICTTTETRENYRGTAGNWPSDCTPVSNRASAISAEGETRAIFDDVDDYDDFITETNTFTDQTGINAVTLPGFSRTVAVTYIDSNASPITTTDPVASAAATTDTKRIVVTVTTPTGESLDFVALACNF